MAFNEQLYCSIQKPKSLCPQAVCPAQGAGLNHRLGGNFKGPQLTGVNSPLSQSRPQTGGRAFLGWAGLCCPKKFKITHKALDSVLRS